MVEVLAVVGVAAAVGVLAVDPVLVVPPQALTTIARASPMTAKNGRLENIILSVLLSKNCCSLVSTTPFSWLTRLVPARYVVPSLWPDEGCPSFLSRHATKTTIIC